MVPTTAPRASQTKISDAFRASSKSTKPVKQTPAPAKPKPVEPEQEVEDKENHLIPNDPKFVRAAKAIEAERQAPLGILSFFVFLCSSS
jgi:hypothetical protein